MISSRLEMWGQQEAEQALLLNINNRTLRKTHVQNLLKAIQEDQWKVTHQGVAFDDRGVFIDGQHRAEAIRLSGKKVPIMVTRGLPPDSSLALDIGVLRTNADILNVEKPFVEVANLAARVASSDNYTKIPPFVAKAWLSKLEPFAQRLLSACSKKRRYFSSSPIKLAAVIRMMDGESSEYVCSIYTNLCLLNLEKLPPVGRVLVSQHVSGVASLGNGIQQVDALSRGMYVFSKKEADRTTLIRTKSSIEYAKQILTR